MIISRRISALIGLAIIVGCMLLNQWIFSRWLGTTYYAWYIANGSLIGVLTSFIVLSWSELNRHTGLISAHPLEYLGSYLQLAGLPLIEIGTHMRRDAAPAGSRSGFDLLVTSVVAAVVSLGILAWIWAVVPIQYFVYLVCGAPGRLFAVSERRVIAHLKLGSRLETDVIYRGEKVAEGWWEASFASKPVAATGILAALLLAVVKLLR